MGSASPRAPGNLPAELVGFVGRHSELLDLEQMLTSSRLVTLVGPGGVGKTRLALHIARASQRQFPDGVWFVDISPLRDPELLAPTVAAALQLQDMSTRWAPSVLADQLASKNVLLILDNCEYLNNACAVLVDALLRRCPGLQVLATSRQPLEVAGEQLFVVRPLLVPPSDTELPLTELERCDAVALFINRAKAADPGFAVTEKNARSVIDLCRRLDGLALAIELAAARIRHMSVEQINERLDAHHEILQSGSSSLAPRQRSLRSLIRWSYDLCTPAEQTLWVRLTVFMGSFSAGAAEVVCSDDKLRRDEIMDILTGLVDKSIVSIERSSGATRYRMLETIRAFGQNRLTSAGQVRELRVRHRDFYRDHVVRSYLTWFGPGQVDLLNWITHERENMRAALDFSLGDPAEVAAGAVLGTALGGIAVLTGLVREGRRWIHRALDSLQEISAERARLLWIGGQLALEESAIDEAETMLTDSRAIAEQVGDTQAAAIAAALTGAVYVRRDELPRAMDILGTALAEVSAKDVMARAQLLEQQAVACYRLGDVDKGIALCREAIAISEAHGERWHRSEALWELSLMYWEQGEFEQSDAAARSSLRLHRLFGSRVGTAECFETLSWIASRRGEHERAARLLGAADAIWQATDITRAPQLVRHSERMREATRAALGERRFAETRRRGMRTSIADSIVFALEEKAEVPESTVRAMAQLTEREREVAELIAAGHSNKEIAAALVISHRTVEGHVEHILAKLGFSTRVQIASWLTALRADSAHR
ncbi:ATP-binding protein [Nocardia sp. NBC_00881]|uniref:ATP-binding protein n=1 Tax=Nocardia sp. NBC_00881 TaxID=2975995 RepID=UPI003863B21F